MRARWRGETPLWTVVTVRGARPVSVLGALYCALPQREHRTTSWPLAVRMCPAVEGAPSAVLQPNLQGARMTYGVAISTMGHRS